MEELMQNTAEYRKNDGKNVISIYEDKCRMVSCHEADDIRQRMERARERKEERLARRIAGYLREELDNCIYGAQDALLGEESETMAHERTRVLMGKDRNGKPLYKQISGKNQDERNDAIVRAYIQSGRIWEFIEPASIVSLGAFGNASAADDRRNDITFEEYARTWFDRYKRGQKSATYEYQLERRMKRLSEYFGNKPVATITTDDVQDYFRQHENLSKSYISTVRATLREILAFAEEEKILPDGAVKWRRVTKNGTEPKTRRSASVEEYDHVLKQLDTLIDPVEHLTVAIFAYTGMRPEELRGLRWEEIDFDKRLIHIERAVTFAGKRNERVCKDTKTPASKGAVPMNRDLYARLMKYRKPEGWIIYDKDGEPFKTYNRWRKFWTELSTRIDLHALRSCEFRKTVPTVMNARGVDPKSIQKLLRHKKLDTTMNTYMEADMSTYVKGCETLALAGA